mmetsp:Transcript_18709/g.63728  ORF Transcript_18709/g.63728 Transcript_18709/m.63728 type:complete len:251 (+) Transcript_18709:40-792(+)
MGAVRRPPSSTKKPGWYRRRSRHISGAQRRALRELWPVYGLAPVDEPGGAGAQSAEVTTPHALWAAFGLGARPEGGCVLELGFGRGETLLSLARERPDAAVLGVEWHRGSLGAAVLALEEAGRPQNVRLVKGEAVHLLRRRLPTSGGWLDAAVCVCPDPWPGSADVHRRVLRPEGLAEVARALRSGGELHLATDSEAYADAVLESAGAAGEDWAVSEVLDGRPSWRVETMYERKALQEGRGMVEVRLARR